jgi:hypothetical protein
MFSDCFVVLPVMSCECSIPLMAYVLCMYCAPCHIFNTEYEQPSIYPTTTYSNFVKLLADCCCFMICHFQFFIFGSGMPYLHCFFYLWLTFSIHKLTILNLHFIFCLYFLDVFWLDVYVLLPLFQGTVWLLKFMLWSGIIHKYHKIDNVGFVVAFSDI